MKLTISAVTVVLNYIFYAQKEALTALFCLVMIDTITGGMLAYKRRQFSSAGFFRFASKLWIYLLLMATACLVDKILPVQFSAMTMTTFLVVTEAISISENLKMKGADVPAMWITILIKIRNRGGSKASDQGQAIENIEVK
jgi:toxin secretion/phage lysis holin